MANFTSLPNELVREILKLVQPEDLESFAQSSRNVFALASPFLAEHRALIRRYRSLRNDAGAGSIATLLKTIIANPRIGSYVQKADLSLLMRPQSANAYTKEELELFTLAAQDSECVKKLLPEEVLDEREFWSRAIRRGSENILLAVLLPLLPNLEALTVASPTYVDWYDSVVRQAASATKPTLCKLAQIRLSTYDKDGYSLTEIQNFCALPSVRVLTALNAYGEDCLDDLIPDTNSHVTHLKLWDSCIDSTALHEFLRGFSKLQSFTYSYAEDSDQVSNDSFLIRSSLLAHCKSTLQSLTLLAPNRRHTRSGYTSFMGSLRGFDTLREIYTEWIFLISETSNSRGPQLNENLPASLVWLKIHDSEGREKSQYERVIKSAQYARELRLQNFKWLIFGGTRVGWSLETIDRGLRKTCLNMGITLKFSPYAPKSGD